MARDMPGDCDYYPQSSSWARANGFRGDGAMYLAGVLLQDIHLHISPPRNNFCLLPEGRRRFGYIERTSVEMVARIHGPTVFDATNRTMVGSHLSGDPHTYDAYHSFLHIVEAFYQMIEHPGCQAPLVALGPGHLCHHCGNYSPSGSLRCWRCNGLLKMVDFIHPVRFPFYAARRPQDASLSYQLIVSFDLMAEVDDVDRDVAPFFTSNPRLLPAGCSLDTGLYLCKYCGYAVKEGEICPGCGGERVPLMELISLDRECRYCGSTMKGGIACPDCGARIAGMALRELWRER